MEMSIVALGLLWYFAFLFSTTLHEAGHAWAALRLGDPTAYHGGQVSLNPIPHLRREPFGMLIVPVLIYALTGSSGNRWMVGWASAPYDPQWADRYPRRAALMALAGPAANLLLVALSALAIRVGIAAGVFSSVPRLDQLDQLVQSGAGAGWEAVSAFVSIVFMLNLILFLFNLIPLPPLDGSGALPLVMTERLAVAHRQALRHPGIAMAGLLLAWWLFPFVLWPLASLAVELLFS
jgi:Zn-dependent protease